MTVQMLNLISTRRCPSRKRRSKLISKPVVVGGIRIPEGKRATLSVDNYVKYKKQIDLYVESGIILLRGSNKEVLAQFWKDVESAIKASDKLTSDFIKKSIKERADFAEQLTEIKEVIKLEPNPENVQVSFVPPHEDAGKVVLEPAAEQVVGVVPEQVVEVAEVKTEPAPIKAKAPVAEKAKTEKTVTIDSTPPKPKRKYTRRGKKAVKKTTGE